MTALGDDIRRAGILWVTPEVPDRDGGGGNQVQAHLLRELAREVPVDVLVAGEVRDPVVRASARTITEVEPTPPLPTNRLRRRASAATTAWLGRQPLEVVANAALRDSLAAPLAAGAPAVGAVVVNHLALAPLLLGPRFGHARWVLFLHHAAADRAAQLAAVEPRRLQAALLRRDAVNLRAVEQNVVDHADRLVVLSAEDAVRLGRPGTATTVVPLGADVERATPAPLTSDPVVLFTGTLDYPPNVDGLRWFAESVWPAVRSRVPRAQLLVVGRHPAPEVQALDGRDAISVHPDVPEMAPWFARARVAVAPLRAGTGARLKAMEALAAGRALVGTRVALEGIELGPDDADVVDDPVGFAEAVVRLLDDDDLARARGERGRALAETKFTWRRSARLLLDGLA